MLARAGGETGGEGNVSERLAKLGRRLVTIPAYFLLAALSVLLAPLWIPVLAIADWRRSGTRAALRCGAFFTWYLQCQCGGLAGAIVVWVMQLPPGVSRERYLAWNFTLQKWWGNALLRGTAAIFDVRYETDGIELTERGPYLLFMRHSSTGDTLLSILLVSVPYDVMLRYVFKRELRWDPCIDVVGGRMINYFVDRDSSDSAREIAEIVRLSEDLGEREALIIYPEGTRFTPEKQQRVFEKLREKGDFELLARAETLRHLLPPRLGGPLALLEANRGLDVVFCAHTGWEGVATFWDLWAGNLLGRVIRVHYWRVPFEEIPKTRAERVDWLYAQWKRVDDWIEAHHKLDRPATS